MSAAYLERFVRFALGLLAAALLLTALVRFAPGLPALQETSLRTNRPTAEMVGEALPFTLRNLAAGVGLALPLALLLGIPAGLRPGSTVDRTLQGLAVALAGVPAFTAAVLAVRLLVQEARMPVPAVGRAVLALVLAAWMARAIRNGLASMTVTEGSRRASRVALAVGGSILQQAGNLLVISMVMEIIFPGPGLWRTLITGIMTRDLPVVYAALWPVVLLGLVGHLLGDLLVTAAATGPDGRAGEIPTEAGPMDQGGHTPAGVGVRAGRSPSRTWLVVGALLTLALLVPLPWSAGEASLRVDLQERLQPPGPGHPLGTDQLGRDLLRRIGHGTRLSLKVALGGTALAAAGGLVLAGLGHALGRWGRVVLSPRVAVPGLLGPVVAGMAVALILSPGVVPLILALGTASVPAAARAFRYLLERRGATRPGAGFLGLIVLTFAQILLAESILSFLGVGVQPPLPSLGNLLGEGMPYVLQMPHWLWGAVPGALGLAGLFLTGHGLAEPAEVDG